MRQTLNKKKKILLKTLNYLRIFDSSGKPPVSKTLSCGNGGGTNNYFKQTLRDRYYNRLNTSNSTYTDGHSKLFVEKCLLKIHYDKL